MLLSTLGRPRGECPWHFSNVTFLMIPIAKIASSYLLLRMGTVAYQRGQRGDSPLSGTLRGINNIIIVV